VEEEKPKPVEEEKPEPTPVEEEKPTTEVSFSSSEECG